jgi:hypothetical protein
MFALFDVARLFVLCSSLDSGPCSPLDSGPTVQFCESPAIASGVGVGVVVYRESGVGNAHT